MTLISHLGSLELRPKIWLHYEPRLTAFTALLVLVMRLASARWQHAPVTKWSQVPWKAWLVLPSDTRTVKWTPYQTQPALQTPPLLSVLSSLLCKSYFATSKGMAVVQDGSLQKLLNAGEGICRIIGFALTLSTWSLKCIVCFALRNTLFKVHDP